MTTFLMQWERIWLEVQEKHHVSCQVPQGRVGGRQGATKESFDTVLTTPFCAERALKTRRG